MIAKRAKKAYYELAQKSVFDKKKILLLLSQKLLEKEKIILEQNTKDIKEAKKNGSPSAMIDRLTVNKNRLISLSDSVKQIASMRDPIGEVVYSYKSDEGLMIHQERSPLGVVMVIFESRPNVVIDIAALSIKSSNACILKGGKEAHHTNTIFGEIIQQSLCETGISENAVQVISSTDRNLVTKLLKDDQNIDVVIPRGGKSLIDFVSENSKIPVIKHDAGLCHTYIDENADLSMCLDIVINAKTQRPGVCNAMETLLIHKDFPYKKEIISALLEKNVEIRGDKTICSLFPSCNEATQEDWHTEYLDMILSIKIINGLAEAINWINQYGSNHSDAIITSNQISANRFMNEVDSACVLLNSSSRFSDGGCFGLGSEVGISTQKLHVRGPMGLKDLTSLKYKVYGHGQIRT